MFPLACRAKPIGGLEFGASIRADNAAAGNSGTGGSQYLSGSFGKISMGDLNGADEDMVGGYFKR